MTFNVIAFDGGGVRGAFSARLLERLTREVPELVHQTMLLAGTSTGGIIALGLAHGLSPAALVRLYREHAEEIFDRRILGGVWGSKYSATGLRRVLEQTFGDVTLGRLMRHTLIPTLDLDAPARDSRPRSARAKFFESRRDSGARVVDVALATSAAPAYFPSHDGYVDGGLVANSPAPHAAAQAIHWGVPRDDLRVLAIGTGLSPSFIEGDALNWGALRWAPKIAPLMIDGVSGVSDYLCRQLLREQYHRLDAVLPQPVELDDAGAVEHLVEAADAVDLAPTVAWLQLAGWARETRRAG